MHQICFLVHTAFYVVAVLPNAADQMNHPFETRFHTIQSTTLMTHPNAAQFNGDKHNGLAKYVSVRKVSNLE